jgi:hypothetical protein
MNRRAGAIRRGGFHLQAPATNVFPAGQAGGAGAGLGGGAAGFGGGGAGGFAAA